MLGESAGLAHSLLPLSIAVESVERALRGNHRSRHAIGAFIVSTVPVYEYFANPGRLPRALLRRELENSLLGEDLELLFLDGRPTKRQLAVNADDVACVAAMLGNPAKAGVIHSRRVRFRSRELVNRAKLLGSRSRLLAATAQAILGGQYESGH